MAKQPKVSVLCLTFNQAKYLRQALDGFLMQETDFEFEILINDDASTDGTVDILKEYQNKHPEIFKLVLQKQNLYSQGKRNFFIRFLIPKAKGQYFALCEGDDYWTDHHKLQLQADFMDQNPNFSMCFHPVKVFYENKEKADFIFPSNGNEQKFTLNELLKSNFIQTNSVMYRRAKYGHIANNVTPGDWYLHLYHAQFGEIGFINKTMAAYRRHAGGMWWDETKERFDLWKKAGVPHLTLYVEALKLFGSEKRFYDIILQSAYEMLNNLINTDLACGTSLLEQAYSAQPQLIQQLIVYQHSLVKTQSAKLAELNKKIQQLLTDQNRNHQSIQQLNAELQSIKQSRVWKTRNKLARASGKKPI